MKIKDYVDKRKDPQAYSERRAHEILRELEDILALYPKKLDAVLNDIEVFKDKNAKEIAETVDSFHKVKDDLHNEVDPRIKELRQFVESTQTEVEGKISTFIQEQNTFFKAIDAKIAEVKLMRGPKGEPGPIGIGKQGDPGDKGDDGSPDTGKQIATKLNTEKESVEPTVIKGLLKTIDDLKRTIRNAEKAGKGGGGMGLPVKFSFTGNGVVTSFTLSNNVAAGGLACWAYYEGQWIQPGTHYSISGKTLTTTFTPANAQIIEGFYIRT